MKYVLSLFFCFFCFFGFSQTQAELNTMQYDSYKKTDKKLNEVYQAILKAYKSDTEKIIPTNPKSHKERLLELKELLEDGLLTKDEYESKRSLIVNEI